MRWFPKHRGLVMGIVVSGFGLSTLVFAPIQLAITNPNNVKPDNVTGIDDKYFTDADVLDRVHTLLYTQAALFGSAFLLATLMLTTPDDAVASEEESAATAAAARSDLGRMARIKLRILEYRTKILSRRDFYILFITRFGFNLNSLTLGATFKPFAQTFIADDRYITYAIGAVSAIFQIMSRMSYGLAVDLIPYKWVICFQSLCLFSSFASLYFTAALGRAAFTLWMYFIFLTFPGIYAIIPARAAEVFGPELGSTVIGFIAFSDLLTVIVVFLAGKAFLHGQQRDYLHMFLFTACCGALVSFIINLFFPPTKNDITRKNNIKKRLTKLLVRKGTDSTTSGVDNIAFDKVKEENKDNGATSGQ